MGCSPRYIILAWQFIVSLFEDTLPRPITSFPYAFIFELAKPAEGVYWCTMGQSHCLVCYVTGYCFSRATTKKSTNQRSFVRSYLKFNWNVFVWCYLIVKLCSSCLSATTRCYFCCYYAWYNCWMSQQFLCEKLETLSCSLLQVLRLQVRQSKGKKPQVGLL